MKRAIFVLVCVALLVAVSASIAVASDWRTPSLTEARRARDYGVSHQSFSFDAPWILGLDGKPLGSPLSEVLPSGKLVITVGTPLWYIARSSWIYGGGGLSIGEKEVPTDEKLEYWLESQQNVLEIYLHVCVEPSYLSNPAVVHLEQNELLVKPFYSHIPDKDGLTYPGRTGSCGYIATLNFSFKVSELDPDSSFNLVITDRGTTSVINVDVLRLGDSMF